MLDIFQKQLELFAKTEEQVQFAKHCAENPNLLHSLPDDVYRAALGINQSSLEDFRTNQRKYHWKHVLGHKDDPTQAMNVGSLFHRTVLEPHTVHEKYISDQIIVEEIKQSRPELVSIAASKEYKEFIKGQEAKGVTVLKQDIFDSVAGMLDAVYSHPYAKNMLKNGTPEAAMFAKDPISGLMLKGKVDFLLSDGYLIDIKSTDDASPDEFKKSVYTYNYYIQAAYYLKLAQLAYGKHFKHFLFICVEKKAPYEVAIYQLDEGALDAGERVMTRDLRMLSQAIAKNEWQGYGNSIKTLTLPHWAWGQLEEKIDG
jgi:exodeoxyribonuclease VIII